MIVLYRTVRHNPPSRNDFRSGKEMDITKPGKTKERFWLGFSVYDSFERANATAIAYPRQGDYVAEFAVPDAAVVAPSEETFTLPPTGGITLARTLGPGHWTVWGEPELFPSLVRRIIPVRR